MSSPLNIGIIHPSFRAARTAERTLMEHVKLLRKQKHHVAVFTAELSEFAAQFFESLEVPVVVLKAWFYDLRRTHPSSAKKAGSLLKRFSKGFDRLIVHDYLALIWVGQSVGYAPKKCPPLIWCCYQAPLFLYEESPSRKDLKLKKLLDKCTSLLRHIFTPSPYSASQLRRLFSCSVQHLPFGIEMPIMNPPVQKRVKSRFTIGCVSDLEPGKNVMMVLDAFHHWGVQNPELKTLVTLDIVGEGSQKPTLEAHAKSLGLEKHIHFLGWIPDASLRRKFQEWEFILCLPLQTSYSRVILEAGIYGKPCIVSNQGGIKELVQDKKTGFLVDPSSIESISVCLEKLCTDPDLIYDMGFKIQDYIAENFDAEACVSALLASCVSSNA